MTMSSVDQCRTVPPYSCVLLNQADLLEPQIWLNLHL